MVASSQGSTCWIHRNLLSATLWCRRISPLLVVSTAFGGLVGECHAQEMPFRTEAYGVSSGGSEDNVDRSATSSLSTAQIFDGDDFGFSVTATANATTLGVDVLARSNGAAPSGQGTAEWSDLPIPTPLSMGSGTLDVTINLTGGTKVEGPVNYGLSNLVFDLSMSGVSIYFESRIEPGNGAETIDRTFSYSNVPFFYDNRDGTRPLRINARLLGDAYVEPANGIGIVHTTGQAQLSNLNVVFVPDEPPQPVSEFRWINPAGGSFTNSNNWDVGQVPDESADVATFDIGANYTVQFPANIVNGKAVVSAGNVTFDLMGQTYVLQDGVDYGLVVESPDTELTLTNGSVHATELRVRSAVLNVSDLNGARSLEVQRDFRVTGQFATQQIGAASISSSTVNVGGDTWIGDDGEDDIGVLELTSHTLFQSATGRLIVKNVLSSMTVTGGSVASFLGGPSEFYGGTVRVEGAGSTLRTMGLTLHSDVSGVTIIDGASADSDGNVVVNAGFSDLETTTYAAYVSGSGSKWSITDTLIVGQDRDGYLQVRNGGKLTADQMQVIYGVVNVNGANSAAEIEGDITVGVHQSFDTGGVTVAGGAKVSAGGNIMLQGSSVLTVDGAGSRLEVVGSGAATGKVTNHGLSSVFQVSGGATATMLSLDVGGSLSVKGGGGTRVDVAESVTVLLGGEEDQGNLSVTEAGHLKSGGGTVRSFQVTAEGSFNPGARIAGVGSLWEVAGVLLVDGHLRVSDQGVVTADTLFVSSTGRVDGNGGIIRINQLLTQSGAVVNHGLLASGASAGMLTIDGDYLQEADGVLEVEIGGLGPGTLYDVLKVTGDMTINGNVILKFINGFAPQQGEQFEFLTVGGVADLSGAKFAIQNLASGFLFDITPTANGILMTALNDAFFVPEPSLSVLALIAPAALPAVYRRRISAEKSSRPA